jgi:DNA-binding MarR family transcriptional regulator
MTKVNISNLEDHIGYWLRCLSNCVHNSFAASLAEHNISVEQWVVLRTLYNLKDIMLSQAAEIIGVDKGSLSRMVERLVKRGLVNRAEGQNRRSIKLSLTKSGMDLVPKLAKLADSNDERLFRSLTASQKTGLLDMLKNLLAANGWKQSERGFDRMK